MFETPITITPVVNGWIVRLPEKPQVQPLEENPLGLPFKMNQLGDFVRKLKEALEEDPNDLSAILKTAKIITDSEIPAKDDDDDEGRITPERQPNIHVFPTFKEALAFLEFTIDPKD